MIAQFAIPGVGLREHLTEWVQPSQLLNVILAIPMVNCGPSNLLVTEPRQVDHSTGILFDIKIISLAYIHVAQDHIEGGQFKGTIPKYVK